MGEPLSIEARQLRERVIRSMSLKEFGRVLLGYEPSMRDEPEIRKKHDLMLQNFDAFWSEIGMLARIDFINAIKQM